MINFLLILSIFLACALVAALVNFALKRSKNNAEDDADEEDEEAKSTFSDAPVPSSLFLDSSFFDSSKESPASMIDTNPNKPVNQSIK